MKSPDQSQELFVEIPLLTRAAVWAPRAPRSCLLAFHGYGEATSAPMEALLGAGFDDCLIVAPLAPHHFYNRKGEVVGSWMTRLDREHRVEELLIHAQRLWVSVCKRYGEFPLDLFGFSQGAAHAYRVALLAGLPVRQCFVLGGDLPPELQDRPAQETDPALVLFAGEDDDRVPLETVELDARQLGDRGYDVALRAFPGGHSYLPLALVEMRSRISELGDRATRKETD